MESNKIGLTQDTKEQTSSKIPTEDLPLPERVKLADSINAYEGMTSGWLIDAKDTVDNWCIGNVLNVEGGEVKINYDGWSSKYDTSFKLKSYKIAPFRLFSKGYTGQVKIPLHKIEFSPASLAERKKELEEVIESKFKSLKTANEVTQYLRGKVYTYVDFLMASEYTDPDKEIPLVVDFLKLAIKLIATWLSLFPEFLKAFVEWQNNPKLILIDRNVALAACGYELLDMLGWLFCLCPRTLIFFSRYDMPIEKEIALFTKPFDKEFEPVRNKDFIYDLLKDQISLERDMIFGLFINLFNTFCHSGGLKAVIDIISLERFSEKASASGMPNYKLPLDIIAMLLYPFKAIKAIARPEVCKEIAVAGKTSFFQRVQQLEDKDIKDINKDQITNAMSLMKGFLKLIHSEEEVSKFVQTHEMLVSLKFLKSSSLEKRLNGLADIKRMIDRVEPIIVGKAEPSDGSNWFNAEYLAKWIEQNKILEKILDDNVHAEMIKRISHILIFMAKKGAMTTSTIELLWKCQQDKHEDIIRVVYDTIKEIIEYFSLENIKYIHEKLKAIPLEACDEKLISFMKDFTIKAFVATSKAEDSKRKKDEAQKENNVQEQIEIETVDTIERTPTNEVAEPSSEDMFCLPKIWSLIQDDSPVSQAVAELANNTFREIMLDIHSRKWRPQYFYLCIENLKNHRTIQPSLVIGTILLLIMNSQKKSYKVTIQEWVRRMGSEYNLPAIILSSCQYYAKCVESAIRKGLKVENIAEAVIIGKAKHSLNLDQRFKLLECLLRCCGDSFKFGKENVLKLWNLYVEESPCQNDTKSFLTWLCNERDSTTMNPTHIFPSEENLALFEIICKSRAKLEVLDILYYKCFSNTFKIVNIAVNTIENKRGRIRALKFDSITGLDSLWENMYTCSQDASRIKFCELLIDLYTNVTESSSIKKKEILTMFIDRCMNTIIKVEATAEELPITNLVKLLIQFYDLTDGKRFDVQDEAMTHKFTISVIHKPAMECKKIEAGLDVTLGQIRRKIATEFHLPFNGFQISGLTRTYDPEDDEAKLRNLGWQHQLTIQKLPGDPNEDPKLLLAQNQTYLNHLFLLLSKESTSYVGPVWNLLTTLPPNKSMQNDIENLNIPEKDGWNSLLDSNSIYKFLYSLQIVEDIVTITKEAEKEKKEKWLAKFVEKGGLIHLFSALTNLPIVSLSNQYTRKCFSLLLKMLFMIQSAGYSFKEHIPKYEEKRQSMIERVLLVLEAFAHHSILPETSKIARTPKKQKSIELGKKISELPKKIIANVKAAAEAAVDPAEIKEKKQQEEESKAFEYGFSLIKGSQKEQFNYFEIVMKVVDFKEFLLKGLVLSDNPFLQDAFAQELISIYKVFKGKEYNETHAHIVLIPFMLKNMIFATLEKETKCKKFYGLLCNMIKDMKKEELIKLPIDFHAEVSDIAMCIKNQQGKETKSTDTDFVIIGLLNLLEALLGKFPEEKENTGQKIGMVSELLHQCLFDFPKSGNRFKTTAFLPPKCKSQAARQAAFNLLCTLACDTPKNLNEILDYLTPIHANGAWRTKRISDWNIIPETSEKSLTGYVGIKNLGCICYMNSLLQQMYMIPSFRNDILAVDDPNKSANPDENMLFQTQCLFSALQESVKQSYNPKVFCHAFKDWEGKSINVLEQMDVDEFFNLFLDKLEFSVKGTPQANTIKYHFGGVFANQLLCKDCPHNSAREEPFLALNLQVKNKKSLQQCLESFVEGEMLQGSNAYHCDKCDKKVTTLKRVCIKRLPRYVICVLKRFDINYDTMQKFKINDYCEFPAKINMEAYTEEGLAKKDKEKEREKAKKEGRDIEEIPSQGPTKAKYPPEYYEYKLTGVVIHLGNADAGHYYSLIMDREKENVPEKEKWFEFNDTLVDKYNPDDIKDDAFGGEERIATAEGSLKMMGKYRNAYLLVYERATPYDPPSEEEEDDKAKKMKVAKETIIPPAIHDAIMSENIKYWYNKYMFHDDYFEFAVKLFLTWNSVENILAAYPSKNCDYHLLGLKEDVKKSHGFQTEKALVSIPEDQRLKMNLSKEELRELEVKVFKYAATMLLTTIVRERMKTNVPDFVDITKAYINKHVEAAEWILNQFTNPKIISEFLFECIEINMRRTVVGLLYCSMLKVYEKEQSMILSAVTGSKSVLVNFANCVFNQLAICRKYTIYFEQFFQLFSRLAFVGPSMREYFLRTGAIRRLLGFWASSTESKWNSFADIPFEEPKVAELGLPSVVDERFQSPFEELFAMRREKIIKEGQGSYTFLFEALSMLLRSTTMDEKQQISPLALPGCFKCIGLDEFSKTMLTDSKTINLLIGDCRNEISSNSMMKCFTHISWENIDMKMSLLKMLIDGMNASEWEDIRKYFYFFKAIMTTEDSMQAKFMDIALPELDKMIKANQNAYYATFTSLKNILLMAKESKVVAEWYKKNNETCNFAINWFTQNPYPSFDSSEVKLYKAKEKNLVASARNPGGFTQEEKNGWSTFTQSVAKKFTTLKDGEPFEFDDQGQKFEADTLYYEKFYKNQIVEFYDLRLQTWERHIVKRVLDEMILILQEGMPEKYADWVEVESSSIAREGTHTKEKVEAKKSTNSEDSSKNEEDQHFV